MSTYYNILEAEQAQLSAGFDIINATSQLGPYVWMPRQGTATITMEADGYPGVYDLVVYYYDQNHGAATATVSVDGAVLDSWVWNKNLGSSMASAQTHTSRVIPNVTIENGSTIQITGQRRDGEEVRIDKVVLKPAADRTLDAAKTAFPEVEGYGSATTGGRGGWIVKVTNLNDSGPGSLRWALEELDEPRIVVFEVGGVINLKSRISVQGDVTVAGQTAPGEGVTIRGARLEVVEDNVIIQGLKFRPGGAPGEEYIYRDGISIGSDKTTVNNVVIDHNSFSWSVDELVDVWYGAHNITISNNIFAEGLLNAGHPNGAHSMAMLLGDGAHNITVVNNLFMSNEYRNPSIAEATNVELVNNYVYNYGQYAVQFTPREGLVTRSHIIGNVYERGPSTGIQQAVRIDSPTDGALIYLRDNLSDDRPDSTYLETALAYGPISTVVKSAPVFTGSNVKAMPAADVKAYVLANAGARAQGLDATDARLINEAKTGGGGLKNAPPSGAYTIPSVAAGPARPHEVYLSRNGEKIDPHRDGDGDGYSDLEEHIFGLIPVRNVGAPATAPTFRVQAEDFTLVKNFVVQAHHLTSGAEVIAASGGAESIARHVFNKQAGYYDLKVTYYDEDDGAATMQVYVNGDRVDQWLWNQQLSPNIGASSRATRVIDEILLEAGDVVELRGYRHAGEPVRTDYVDFVLARPLGDPPPRQLRRPAQSSASRRSLSNL